MKNSHTVILSLLSFSVMGFAAAFQLMPIFWMGFAGIMFVCLVHTGFFGIFKKDPDDSTFSQVEDPCAKAVPVVDTLHEQLQGLRLDNQRALVVRNCSVEPKSSSFAVGGVINPKNLRRATIKIP